VVGASWTWVLHSTKLANYQQITNLWTHDLWAHMESREKKETARYTLPA
jgi:hypothetical protein